MKEVEKTEDHKIYLGLGSNIDPEENLTRAMALLRQAVPVIAVSRVWETPPIGDSGPNFLNAAALVQTWLSAEELRFWILRPIEAKLGRVRTANPNAARTIDLDILIFDDLLIDKGVWERAHLCVPLSEILPDYTQPGISDTLRVAAEQLKKISPIQLRYDIRL